MSTVRPPESWRCPPLAALLVAVALIACAEMGGGAMVRFKLELARWVRSVMVAHADTHGLVGVRDIDEQVLDEALVKFDAGLRLFHMHAEGMGLVIIATTTVAATLVASPRSGRAITLLLTAGGAGYPLGYLVWSALIPYYGIERGKTVAEWLCWIPFGGATVVAMGDQEEVAEDRSTRLTGTPTFYVIDRQGRLVGRAVGPHDWITPRSPRGD